MTSLITKARDFAQWVHRKQVRKYNGEPYFNHLVNVASTLAALDYPDEVVAAAYLHDTVEDQEVTLDLLTSLFGSTVADIVDQVTDRSKPSDGNRQVRKEIDRAHLAKADWRGQAVKLADMIDNSVSISKHDPDFAKVYFAEKVAILDTGMNHPANRVLRDRVQAIVEKYYADGLERKWFPSQSSGLCNVPVA